MSETGSASLDKMSNRALATGVFRAWGLMWAITALIALPQFVNTLIRNPYRSQGEGYSQFVLSSSATSLGLQIVVAVFLVSRAAWLAEIVFPIEQDLTLSLGPADFRAILFATVGLYFLIDGGRRLVGTLFRVLARPRGDGRGAVAYVWERQMESVGMGLAAAVAGAFLLFGRAGSGKGIRGVYDKVFGLKETTDEGRDDA